MVLAGSGRPGWRWRPSAEVRRFARDLPPPRPLDGRCARGWRLGLDRMTPKSIAGVLAIERVRPLLKGSAEIPQAGPAGGHRGWPAETCAPAGVVPLSGAFGPVRRSASTAAASPGRVG